MKNTKAIIALIILGFGMILFGGATFQVKETEQAIVLEFGEWKETVREAGIHFKVPFIQNVIFFDRRIRILDMQEMTVITADQKRMNVDAFAEYMIEDPLRVYQAVVNERGAENRLSTIAESNLRKVFGVQLLQNTLSGEREDLRRSIQDAVTIEAAGLGIKVVDVRIKRTDLPPENSAPIFQSMIADRNQVAREVRARGEEEALRITSKAERDRTVILAEATRDSEKIRGEGDAIASKTYADAYNKDAEFYAFYRSMEVYKNSMKNGDTSMILSPDSEFFKYFENMGGQ
ncbi:MAG: protease modulator HflC [Emcibacteraceae bacterium]|jgi:membrane protease subunit HflC|uniref:protease modulator HflC n=1 Tax=Pseudemcibacter sp. TaxID=2943293 RepID=UPI00230A6AA1|nr:protease modulator HflC [Kordiimonadaceae bacterium]MDA7568582.1 protease modulator HflC [Emcibacteraceae bacterium]MDA9553783.1 protease modulator HflC [Emcibacteraceae bacterium]MDG1021360.1 protease modulator HflC [Emcibacteraceae bacterium]MDG1727012.1 protease modulator HflC [Emcibacteraceae bacterium]